MVVLPLRKYEKVVVALKESVKVEAPEQEVHLADIESVEAATDEECWVVAASFEYVIGLSIDPCHLVQPEA